MDAGEDPVEALVASATRGEHDAAGLAAIVDRLRSTLSTSNATQGTYKTHATAEDPSFQSSLLAKKEFYQRRIMRAPDIEDFTTAASKACSIMRHASKSFVLSENQSFIRNFISPRTPYNGVLLYHDVGVGKTCSAISIAERFPDRRVTVLAPSSVQAAFRKQMFDASKVTLDGDGKAASSDQCTGMAFLKGLPAGADMDAHAQRLISQRYAFKGFNKFANDVGKLTDDEVREEFKAHLIIVDEAHNLRSQKESGSKPSYRALKRVLQLCRGTKLVLLTATPMFNEAREIVDLINLLLVNDGRRPMKRSAVFAEDGALLDREALARACVGYISHVSGRNPLRFPIVLDPGANADPAVVSWEALPKLDVAGEPVPVQMRIKTTRIVGSEMSRVQYLKYVETGAMDLDTRSTLDDVVDAEEEDEVKAANDEDAEGLPPSFRPGFEVSNVAFPMPAGQKARGSSASFWNCFRRAPGKEFAVEYIPGSVAGAGGGFLAPHNLGTYSCKFKTIIERITASEGITFVYSRFLWAGLVPFAIALEHAGFGRHGQRNILASNGLDAGRAHARGSYIMLTSDTRLCTKSAFAKDLATVVDPNNAGGQVVKVILACGVAAEGIDFKCVRSVHLVDPWYHNNKVAQIIGRATRNCSHAELPVSHRNVTVYLHASLPPKGIVDARETVDLHAYRVSEFKQSRINRIERLLRAVSIDCELNRHSQQADALANATVDVVTSQGTLIKGYRVGNDLASTSTTCVIDTATSAFGQDESTYDAWYHSGDLIERNLEAIMRAFANRHIEAARYEDLVEAVGPLLDGPIDDPVFMRALQKGIEDGKIKYRGGVYIPVRVVKVGEGATPDRCTSVIPVQAAAASDTGKKSKSRASKSSKKSPPHTGPPKLSRSSIESSTTSTHSAEKKPYFS